MPSFTFNISSNVWNSSKNIPKKYPINNIQDSFIDLSFNDLSNNSIITTVIVSWSGFVDQHTNDGLSFNSYTIPYYNESSLNITQFGNIPLTRNSANNSNYWQFYNFNGQITASDTPSILSNTSLYSAFTNSSSNTYNNLPLWDISGVTDIRNIFSNSSKFHERIGIWNYTNILQNNVENMISNTGYNPVQTSIFLQDIASNTTFPNDVSLGLIPPYLNNQKTELSINVLKLRKISFNGILIESTPALYNSRKYSLIDLRIVGYSLFDLLESNYTLLDYKSANYTIAELDTLQIYTLFDYKTIGYTLADFTNSGYKPIELTSLEYTALDYKNADYYGEDLNEVFPIVDLMRADYPLSYLRKEGYTINEINETANSYTIFDYIRAGYSLTNLSDAGYSPTEFQEYDVDDLKSNNVFAIDFKNIGYDANFIFNLGYSLSELRDAAFSISEIEESIHFRDLDYANANYSLSDILNSGFPLNNLGTYTPLPDILKQNRIYAYQLRDVGYDIYSIIGLFGYKASDLVEAKYSLSEMKLAGISADDLQPLGFTSTSMKLVGFTALELRNASYTLDEIIDAGYSPNNLRDAGYSLTEIRDDFSILELYNGSYTLDEFIDANYSPFDLYNSLIIPYGPLSQDELVPILLEEYPPSVMGNPTILIDVPMITLSAVYGIFGIDLQFMQPSDFPPWDIKSINLNVNLYLGMPIYLGSPIPITTNNAVSVIDLLNAGFTAKQLAVTIMYSQTNIDYALSEYRKYIPYPVFNPSEIVFNDDNTQVQYNYSTILPFEYSDPLFTLSNAYIPLISSSSSNLKSSILLNGYTFGFYDVGSDTFRPYDSVVVSTKGWLSFSSNLETVNVIRFFPYDNTSSVKYLFWKNAQNIDILEIQMFGHVNEDPFLITIHIHSDGLITLCNGYYDTDYFVPGNILYSNPDPDMVSLTNTSMYYCIPMKYYYEATTNTVTSDFYEIIRFDLRHRLKDCGYLARELLLAYDLHDLKNLCNAADLRNIGYSYIDLKTNGFPMFDIVVAYNIDIGIYEILFHV
jgi:hypothetical protein